MGRKLKEILKDKTPSHTDPQGSYTGIPEKSGEVPVQDADDL